MLCHTGNHPLFNDQENLISELQLSALGEVGIQINTGHSHLRLLVESLVSS